MTSKWLLRAGWASAAGLMMVSTAIAAPGLTAGATVMRSGPGPRYRVVMRVPSGAMIDVQSCSPAWCRISWRYRAGYVPARFVQETAAPPPPVVYAAPPPVYVAPPPPVFFWGPGWGWRGGWHGGWRGGWRR